MLSFMSTLKRRTAEVMVRCSGMGMEAAASMSTVGASAGGVLTSVRDRMCVYAAYSSLRNWSASSCALTFGAAAGAGTGTGAGTDVAHATK
jgi:hypothetical protein